MTIQLFKSLDPLWRKFGVSVDFKNTRWYNRKKDALYEAKKLKRETGATLNINC